MSERTKDWELYEAGKKYNNRLSPNYYDTVDANLAFFHGDQWRNLQADNMPKPVFNIIKRVITFFVASLTSSKIKIHFEPLLYSEQPFDPTLGIKPSDIANAQVENLFEKFKMDFKIKEALFDAAVTADAAAHLYFNPTKKPYGNTSDIRGEIELELVDGTNVYFGNANNNKTDIQPYIIISGRDMVKNLQEEAKLFKTQEKEINQITEDYNYLEQSGDSGKIEVEADDNGKALYIIVYRKVKKKRKKLDPILEQEVEEEYETILASKSVENAYIYKDVDTDLEHYPVAWMNWEKQKNQYHGRALCTGILPNQIFINRMFAMVMYHLMMTAFPKAVYNADMLQTWDNSIGSAIPLHGLGPEHNIKNIAGYLEPGNMSNQIIQAIELAMQYTKETLGISDAALGQIDPKNTSAIIAVQKSSAIPLENPRSNLYEWIEDIGKILFDMMGTYYGQRPISIDIQGEKQVVEYDFSSFKDMWLDVKADVGESSYWSEIASIQTLDTLLGNGHIDIVDYLERIPPEYIPQKEELINQIQERMQMMSQMQQQASDPAALLSQLPSEQQEYFAQASPEEQEMMLQELMNAAQQTPQM
jgi:hypothetical protein